MCNTYNLTTEILVNKILMFDLIDTIVHVIKVHVIVPQDILQPKILWGQHPLQTLQICEEEEYEAFC